MGKGQVSLCPRLGFQVNLCRARERRLLDHWGERGNQCPFSLSVGQGMGGRGNPCPFITPVLSPSVGFLRVPCCAAANWPPSGHLVNFLGGAVLLPTGRLLAFWYSSWLVGWLVLWVGFLVNRSTVYFEAPVAGVSEF